MGLVGVEVGSDPGLDEVSEGLVCKDVVGGSGLLKVPRFGTHSEKS